MKGKVLRKREGFSGQQVIVIPKKIVTGAISKDAITSRLYITDIGYYPKARHHYVNRPAGISQHIIIYCMEGYGHIENGQEIIEIHPSQFYCIPANTPHKYYSKEKEPWTIYWIHFKGEMAGSLVEQLQQTITNNQQYLGYSEKRITLFQEIYTHLEKGYSIDNLRYLNMLFYHFLFSLLYPARFDGAEHPQQKDMIGSAVAFMQQNSHKVLTLTELARFAGLSLSHFSALFKRQTGYAPIEYFNHLKVQKACLYLLTSQMTVKEIGCVLGVDDPYYFSRLFSRLMGVSPGEYRKQNQLQQN